MNTTTNISRRKFIVGTGAGAAGFSLGFAVPSLLGRSAGAQTQGTPEINAWVVIAPDDTVTIRIVRSEMGQGTLTGLAQMVAEELDCDWSKVVTEQPTPGASVARGRPWGNFSTGGSQGIRQSQQYVREGGAAARHVLIAAAADQWQVLPSECTAADSVITHTLTGRTTTYGKVAARAAQIALPDEVTLKSPDEWKLIGKPVLRLDTADKLTGKQRFGTDLELPGMMNAAIKACPVNGGKLASYEAEAVLSMPGVGKVLRVDDTAVAVVAKTWWQAKTALDALPIEWDYGEHAKASSAEFEALLDEGLTAEEAFVGNSQGDADAAIEDADKVVEAVYGFPFQHHATMEPMNATALWTSDACRVWCPTQNGEAAFAACVAASGLKPEQCDVHKINLGGGFGRRGNSDYVTQAVSIAKQMPGTPVKLMWSREEDMLHGMYHPYTKARMVGGLDKDGNLKGLRMRISGQSIVAALLPQFLREDGADPFIFQALMSEGEHAISYGIPDLLIDHAMRNSHLRPGFWRGVNANQNVVYMESFMDELALAADMDPLAFRQKLMADHPKPLAVLNAAAERGGWGEELPGGRGRGLAVCTAFASYVAACAEVSVDEEGELKIHRITAATDPGYAVNPQQIEAQVEGSFVYGLSALLAGECTFEDGQVQQTNFHTYPSMKIAQMPEVETIVMPSGGEIWGGVGEPTIAVAAPAVLNAIFAATGKRIRQLPLSGADLKPA